MGTAKEFNEKYLQNKIQEIAKILGEMQEAAEDTHTEHHFHDAIQFFDNWNRELKPQHLKCICGSTWFRQEIWVTLSNQQPKEHYSDCRACIKSKYVYSCSKCGAEVLSP